MTKILMLGILLLGSTAWFAAQESAEPSATQSSSASGQSGASVSGQSGSMGNNSMSGQTTVQGCLQGSNGNFTLTSDSGTTYQLQGDSAKLSKHNGHEVEVMGTSSGAGSSSSAMGNGSSSGGAGQTLTVSSLKHISKTCSNSTMGK